MYPLRSACPLLALHAPCVRGVLRENRCVERGGCRLRGSRTYEVERAELGGGLVQAGVGREDRAATLTLVADDTTHGD